MMTTFPAINKLPSKPVHGVNPNSNLLVQEAFRVADNAYRSAIESETIGERREDKNWEYNLRNIQALDPRDPANKGKLSPWEVDTWNYVTRAIWYLLERGDAMSFRMVYTITDNPETELEEHKIRFVDK